MTGDTPRGGSGSPQPDGNPRNSETSEANYDPTQDFGTHNEGTQTQSTHHDGDGDNHVHVSGTNQGGIHQYTASVALPEGLARRVFRRPAAPRPMNTDSLKRLRALFVRPERYDEAKRTLEASDTVVLTGEPGSGRRSAAMRLLSEITSSSRELPNDMDEDESLLDEDSEADSAAENEGLLLDLSSRPPEVVHAILPRWESFRAKVAKKRCRLALVLPPETEHLLDSDLLRLLTRIGRPDGREVFARHLAEESVEHTVGELDSPDLQSALRTQRMAELARLALLVRDAKSASADGDFATWLNQALEAFSRRAEHVATWLRKHTEGHDRALILTAAMLEGASTDAVHAATVKLLKTVRFPDDSHILEQTGIAERLSKLDLDVDDRRRVRFHALNFDQEVRTHFWAEHPNLRGKLREWIGTAARLDELDEQSRNGLVVRFAEQCLATGRPDDLPSLTEQWLKPGPNNKPGEMLGCIELVLQTGLQDERFGRRFRKKVYEWAIRTKNIGLSRDFDEVLIRLCAQVIAPSHPDQALVRLHHLARRDDDVVAAEATNQIVKLSDEAFFFRRALHRLSGELIGKNYSQDVNLFLRVADPRRLTSDENRSQALLLDRGVRTQLVTGWRVIQEHPISAWEPQVRAWLQAAEGDHRCTALLDVLIESCDRRTTALSRLHGMSVRWVRDGAGVDRSRRSRVADEFTHRIDACQDLEFLRKTGESTR